MNDLNSFHAQYMNIALEEAQKAAAKGEVPVGAVVVQDETVIGRAHNLRESSMNPVAHAEILALQKASWELKRWRLSGTTLYVTLEPCCMCAGALVLARIDRLVYACTDLKGGACGSIYDIPRDQRMNHPIEVVCGVLEDDCRHMIQSFFQTQREIPVGYFQV